MKTLTQERAKNLRANMTVAEKKLWNKLRCCQIRGLRFRRQVPLGKYIVDFACFEPKIIVEVDGSQHEDQKNYDEERTRYLQTLGYKVLRFWNNEILQEIDTVLKTIWNIYLPPSDLRPPSP